MNNWYDLEIRRQSIRNIKPPCTKCKHWQPKVIGEGFTFCGGDFKRDFTCFTDKNEKVKTSNIINIKDYR